MTFGYDKDELTALEAITEAQKISFAPVLFQVALSLRDLGILSLLDKQGDMGGLASEISTQCHLNQYATDVLLDAALSGRIIFQVGEKFYLGKIGYYLLHDPMTQKNLDFIQDVCYEGLFHLKESLVQQNPVGLKTFGDWATIYPALSLLPEKAKKSWFDFESKEGAEFKKNKGVTAHVPCMIWLDNRNNVEMDGKTVTFAGFPTGAGPKSFQGHWTLDDLEKALTSAIKAKNPGME